MLSKQEQLTELVRELESNNHVFATDPLLITEKLQNVEASTQDKFYQRANMIDSNGKLMQTLNKIDGRIKGIILIMTVLWCISGFLGLFTLLQANVVNFFYVLVCLLGFHTLMLFGWIIVTVINQGSQSPSIITSFINPKALIRGKDDVTQAAVNLYNTQLHHVGMRWYLSKFSHQLWLATLIGMLFAIIFLLIVRQYSFSWESTILSDAALINLTHWLGWFPSMVGFNVPNAEAVIQSRLITETMPLAIARQWASLLVGSLLIYGIVPRAIAWAFCAIMFKRKKMKINFNQPYYQKIINFWQRKIVDEDDFTEKVVAKAPVAEVAQGDKLVALLEYPLPQNQFEENKWYASSFASENHNSSIYDFGILDERDDMDRLLEYLNEHDVQVLLGIDDTSLPDRGTMRKLAKIATHAKQGLIVQLLDINNAKDKSNNDETEQDRHNQELRKQQWQAALAKHNIGLVTPL